MWINICLGMQTRTSMSCPFAYQLRKRMLFVKYFDKCNQKKRNWNDLFNFSTKGRWDARQLSHLPLAPQLKSLSLVVQWILEGLSLDIIDFLAPHLDFPSAKPKSWKSGVPVRNLGVALKTGCKKISNTPFWKSFVQACSRFKSTKVKLFLKK